MIIYTIPNTPFPVCHSSLIPLHSYFNASTGLILATLNDWYTTTTREILNPIHVETRNIHGLILVLYAKFCSHLCIM